MALINCPECDREVSDKAPTCPHCGVPTPRPPIVESTSLEYKLQEEKRQQRLKDSKSKRITRAVWVIILLVISFIVIRVAMQVSQEKRQQEEELENRLKDIQILKELAEKTDELMEVLKKQRQE